jgi:hypothetical protein
VAKGDDKGVPRENSTRLAEKPRIYSGLLYLGYGKSRKTKTTQNQTKTKPGNLSRTEPQCGWCEFSFQDRTDTHLVCVNECELKDSDKALLTWDDSCLGFPSHPEVPSTNWPISVFLTQLLQLL